MRNFMEKFPPAKREEMYQACIKHFTVQFILNTLSILLYPTQVDGYVFEGGKGDVEGCEA
jgi:hypothetical protein